ncbi:MAG: lactate racemase domain-containing protein, partial [Anaerolineae bacterium]
MSAYPVINHDAADRANLVHLGTTPNGTPIVVNRRVVEADLVVAVGNTVPHCLAGWSGGAKIIQPGVCGEETTHHTHALNMYSPVPHLGRLDNPVRQEIE